MFRTAVAVAAAVVAAAFGMSTFERYLLRRSRQYLAWTVAMALFVVGAASLAVGAELGWSSMSFRFFYAAGAVANVPFLAVGQLYLLLKKRTADLIFALTTVATSVSFGVVLSDPFIRGLNPETLPKGSEVFRAGPRILAAVSSAGASLVLVVGTVVGIARVLRVRRSARSGQPVNAGRRIAGLALLLTGTFTLSASGLLNSVLGEMTAFSVTLMVGIVMLFAGFLLSTGSPTSPRHNS